MLFLLEFNKSITFLHFGICTRRSPVGHHTLIASSSIWPLRLVSFVLKNAIAGWQGRAVSWGFRFNEEGHAASS